MIEYETDTRKIKEGQTYVAITGHTVDGHDFIDKAIENGAKKVVVEKDVEASVPVVKVDSTKEFLTKELVEKYSKPFDDLTIIGVTGTNGKTTTCYLTYQMLNELGAKAAYIGTIGFYCNGEKRDLPNTTPDILSLYKLFYEAIEKGCTHVVMEVSSHSLEEERIKGLHFDAAAFTNLTQDHLDFHKTMENYLKAKAKILNYIKPNGTMVVNMDDPHYEAFRKDGIALLGFGYNSNAGIRIVDANYTPVDTHIKFKDIGSEQNIVTNLTSRFNVYNYMTCYSLLRAIGYSYEQIAEATKNVYPPTGRCEIIPVNDGFAVVDYAHTPDAVEKIISSMDELKQGRIITIVGCGGDRDPLKRPIMGNIACSKSDYVIFTNDNPRTEDPEKIMDDIVRDLPYDNYEIMLDRRSAINHGIEIMNPNDMLLILGKGHEDYQIIGHEKIHLDDREIVGDWKKKHEPQLKRSSN